MGITIECRKTKNSIDVGYGGFMKLRQTIADCAGSEFNDFYYRLCRGELVNAYKRRFEKAINEKRLSYKVVDFLYACDCGGKINYGACKEILKVIGDYDDDICYGYATKVNPVKFKDFKSILEDCVKTKSKMVWW